MRLRSRDVETLLNLGFVVFCSSLVLALLAGPRALAGLTAAGALVGTAAVFLIVDYKDAAKRYHEDTYVFRQVLGWSYMLFALVLVVVGVLAGTGVIEPNGVLN